ncbi:MAG: formylglycine-generating enzyme family protein, partial [Planctomycetota bacterium]
ESYAELRHKMDETHSNLIVLDKELQTQLPLQVGSEVGEKDWKLKLAQVYDQERSDRISRIIEEIPLMNDMPDVNDGTFKDFRSAQFSEFKQLRSDLVGIFTAFDAIEAGLELYYFLDDDLPQSNENIRSVWQKWRDTDTLKDTRIRDGLAKLIARISRLEQIEQSEDQRELVQRASETSLHNEAAFAAWIRLDELSDSSWPTHHEDLTQDRNIRDRLKKEFETIRSKNETRGDYLFQVLAGTSLKHEIEFIDKNRSEDGVLGKLVEFATEVNPADSLSECQKEESSVKDVADFVAAEDWQAGKIDKDLFSAESNIHNSNAPVTIETFGQWLMEVKDYKKLENDPRNDSQYTWDDRISKIDREINNELERKPESDYLKKLQSLKSDFDGVMQKISDMRKLPLIEKHKEEIFKCGDYWQELLEVERRLKPEYCKRVDLDSGRLIFATSHLNPNFEPVDVDNKNPVQLSNAWEQIREAVNNKQKEWLDFFYTIDGNDVLNVGWPKYIRSTKDPTVVLRFIPAGPDNQEPFYMAVYEITNSQYRLFLEKCGAKRGGPKLSGWSIFTDEANNKLIQCTVANKPPTVIKWDESGKTFLVDEDEANLPVTWVTYFGAQSYSQWFGGQLPKASQHEYACKAGTGNIYPWGNNIQEIGSYAHVRGPAWQQAASYWSREKDRKVPPLPVAPVGAIEDYQQDRILDSSAIVNTSSAYNSVWPVASANKPNAWDLYDMIGNVWEWCQDEVDDTQSVVCGGSCVAPPKYILLESESDYKVSFSDRDNDVGFRVIVPAK